MRIGTVIVLAAALSILIPAMAAADDHPDAVHASYIASITPDASCDGWFTDVVVRFRWAVLSVDATLTLELFDEAGSEVETIVVTEQLGRTDAEYAAKQFDFAGDWSAFAPTGDYTIKATVSIEAPYVGGIDEDEISSERIFHCEAVPTEVASWSEIKTLYR